MQTNPETLRRMLRQRGMRIGPRMADYLSRKLTGALADDAVGIRLIGSDARTGVPIITSVDPRTLQANELA